MFLRIFSIKNANDRVQANERIHKRSVTTVIITSAKDMEMVRD